MFEFVIAGIEIVTDVVIAMEAIETVMDAIDDILD